MNILDRTQTKRDECRAKGDATCWWRSITKLLDSKRNVWHLTSTSSRRNVPKHVRNTLLYHQDEPIRPSCQMGFISGHGLSLVYFGSKLLWKIHERQAKQWREDTLHSQNLRILVVKSSFRSEVHSKMPKLVTSASMCLSLQGARWIQKLYQNMRLAKPS